MVWHDSLRRSRQKPSWTCCRFVRCSAALTGQCECSHCSVTLLNGVHCPLWSGACSGWNWIMEGPFLFGKRERAPRACKEESSVPFPHVSRRATLMYSSHARHAKGCIAGCAPRQSSHHFHQSPGHSCSLHVSPRLMEGARSRMWEGVFPFFLKKMPSS